MTRTHRMMLLHALHLVVPASLFFFGAPWLASIGVFLGAFALFHDTVHANLGLPRRLNEAILSGTGVLLGVSGLAARRAHLFHHAHPGAPDDMEGRDIDSPLWLAIARAPITWLSLVFSGWNRRIACEWALVMLFAISVRHEYLFVTIAAQATMSLWAGRLSHRRPRWLVTAALPLARWGVSLATLFVTHEAHHAQPWKASFELEAPAPMKSAFRSHEFPCRVGAARSKRPWSRRVAAHKDLPESNHLSNCPRSHRWQKRWS